MTHRWSLAPRMTAEKAPAESSELVAPTDISRRASSAGALPHAAPDRAGRRMAMDDSNFLMWRVLMGGSVLATCCLSKEERSCAGEDAHGVGRSRAFVERPRRARDARCEALVPSYWAHQRPSSRKSCDRPRDWLRGGTPRTLGGGIRAHALERS